MSAHEGVSCDACGKSNFRSKRFKCLICYDYDLCSTCHEQGEISSDHTTEHPMQCILTRQDFDFYYHGERCTSDQPQSLTCPFCGDMGLAFPYFNESLSPNNSTQNLDLYQHLQMKHADDQQSQEVICPICAAMANGEPNLITADLISHISNDHQSQVNTPSSAGEGTNPYSRPTSSTRDYDFGIGAGIRGGFRRGLLRAPGRRGSLGRGSGPVSQHFVVDPTGGGGGGGSGGSGNDPIADLLTQLSTVRRLAAANNNNSSSSNTINLPSITRQQYERERLRTSGRSHHHHHSPHHSQQSAGTSDLAPSIDNDLFDSLFSSAVFIDSANSSANNYQTWTHIVANPQQLQQQQQQLTLDQQSQGTSTTKTPQTTNTESDPSLLRRICDESSSSTLPSQILIIVLMINNINDVYSCVPMISFSFLSIGRSHFMFLCISDVTFLFFLFFVRHVSFRILTKIKIVQVCFSTVHLKATGEMTKFQFGRNILVILLINLINYAQSATVPNHDDLLRVNVTMKNFETTQEDEYAFVQYQIPDEELYIVGYSPLITMNSAHHMLTYACGAPGSSSPFWVGGGSCASSAQMIIHGWARNAPALNLPEDVGFAVGRNTPFKYIVLNIHYLSIMKNDNSGNQIIFSRTPRKYHAGVMLGGTGVYIPPKSNGVRAPFSCQYQGPPVSIFAVRVHAHQWARVNSLYRVRDGKVSQIAKGDPQWPQSFYPLPAEVRVENGDYVIGQCVYDNNEDRVIQAGPSHNDEMCNVYAMYSYEVTKTSDGKYKPDTGPFGGCWGEESSHMASMIPEDSLVPPLKPADIGELEVSHHAHSEHAMNPSSDIEKPFSNDDQSYEEYVDEVEHLRSRNRGRENFDINKILSNLGLPEYEYVDADNYDYLLPKHLTYGKEQTVKLHNAKTMSSDLYTNIETWPDVKSLPAQLGQIGGIALTNSNNELVVFSRGSRNWEPQYFDGVRFRNEKYGPIEENVLIHIDTTTGQTKYQWGAKMFYMSHGLTIDHEGNFWVTDIALHQVLMYKPNDLTHPSLTVGEMFKPGSGPGQFCRPADVAVMKNGDFFVADGYCNSRIVKFNRKGEYVMEWGSPMSGKRDADGFPLPNEWNIVHSIALNEEAKMICGADRENFRIQCFNSDTGEFLRQIRVEKDQNIGAIYAIEFAPNANGTILFAVTGGGQTQTKKVYMIDARTGDILTSFESKPALGAPHDIAVSAKGQEIYVGELASSPANALHKFQLSKVKDLPTQTFIKQIYSNDKNFRTSLIIMVAFAIPVLVAVLIGCIVRIRNLRKLHHLHAFLNDVKTGGVNHSSVLDSWINRRQGFERLEQYSDGENEPLDSNMADDSNDETVNVTPKQQTVGFNNKTTVKTFKIDENL